MRLLTDSWAESPDPSSPSPTPIVTQRPLQAGRTQTGSTHGVGGGREALIPDTGRLRHVRGVSGVEGQVTVTAGPACAVGRGGAVRERGFGLFVLHQLHVPRCEPGRCVLGWEVGVMPGGDRGGTGTVGDW